MLSRKPSLGFTLLCVSLLMAAAGAVLGLGITYFHEVKSAKREINAQFSGVAGEFAQRMTPAFLAELENEEPKALAEIDTYLNAINFTLGPKPGARVKIFNLRENKKGPKTAFTFETPDFHADDEAALPAMLLDVIATGRPLLNSFSGDLEDIDTTTNVLRASLG